MVNERQPFHLDSHKTNKDYRHAHNATPHHKAFQKAPTLIFPYSFLTWNYDLLNNAKKIQNFSRIEITSPSKLRYADELFKFNNDDYLFSLIKTKTYKSDLIKIKNNKTVLYPASNTSIDNKNAFEEEIELIFSLSKSFLQDDVIFFVKPKPTGPEGDYDLFKNDKKIFVGEYTPSKQKFEMMDEEFQTYRYLMMKYSSLVINLTTTFGLDASLARVPIMQLDLNSKKYPNYKIYKNNPHIKKYLLNSNYTFGYSGEEKFNLNYELLERTSKFSKSLSNWCLNSVPKKK